MITISTRDYGIAELKALLTGIVRAQYLLCQADGCIVERRCKNPCKSHTMCLDLYNVVTYLVEIIKEREALELHRDMQESK